MCFVLITKDASLRETGAQEDCQADGSVHARAHGVSWVASEGGWESKDGARRLNVQRLDGTYPVCKLVLHGKRAHPDGTGLLRVMTGGDLSL